MAVSIETVVKQLSDSGIIAQGQLERFVPPKAQPKDADELVAQLVKENHLTKFQAAQVAAGKSKSLILGEYTILDKIGAGGMGQVFKALHRRMDRMVAIKMLPPSMTKDAPAVARFEREVRAAAKLSHHNIVAAHDAGQANGVHFLVMEYVEGKDLSALVKKNGPFPVAKATNYILQAARGLEFAHKRGVIHRDIKPANLLLDSEGTVKILDMGLARIETDGNVAAQAELTGTGTIMGTVDYMAPEQGMSTKHADARADIYSLGCSLYYLIAGKATYEGETMAAKLVAHHTQAIPDLRTVHPNVSEQLEAVFKKMVAKRIEDRYQTMTEVIADLEQLVANSGTVSNPIAATAVFDNQEFSFLQAAVATSKLAKPTKKEPVAKSSGGKQPPWKNTKVLIGAGAAGFLFLLLGVILIVRNKDGKEVARLEVAEGNSVEVQPIAPPSNAAVTSKLTANQNAAGKNAAPVTLNGTSVDYALDCSDGLAIEVPQSRVSSNAPITIEVTVRPMAIPPQESSNSGLCVVGGIQLKQYSTKRSDRHVWSLVAVSDIKEETTINSQNYVANKTYRLAASSTGKEIRLFVDGLLVGSQQINGQLSPKPARISIAGLGKESNGWFPFDGLIDEVRISKVARYDQDYTPQARLEADEDTLALYHFDEGTGDVLHDSSGKGHNGTIVGTKWVSADGSPARPPSLSALQFDGKGLVEIPNVPWGKLDTFTLEAWVRADEKPAGRGYVVDRFQCSSLSSVAGHWQAVVHCRGQQVTYSYARNSLELDLGRWTHLANVVRDKTITLYVDGKKIASSPLDGEIDPQYGEKILLGSSFACAIRGVRISKTARYVADFSPLTHLVPDVDTLASYDFAAGSGDTLFDTSGHNVHGKIVGGAQWVKVEGSSINSATANPAPPLAKAPFDAAQAKAHQQAWAKHLGTQVETPNSVGMKMVLIPPGEFMMGSTDEQVNEALKVAEELNAYPDVKRNIQNNERPQQRVIVAKPFFIGATEVTVGQFKQFSASGYRTEAEKDPETFSQQTYLNPGFTVTDDSPATAITWSDAAAFCVWLSNQEKALYRLPTETEWEYCCRAGTTTQYSFGDDHLQLGRYAWHQANEGKKANAVGTKSPNPFGLFDMHGNLLEWCEDFWDVKSAESNTHVVRGGQWMNIAPSCRSAFRIPPPPTYKPNAFGFRIIREITRSRSASGVLFMHDPSFPQWMAQVQAMPAEKQIEAVSKKLMELNPGFDGTVTGWNPNAPLRVEKGAIIDLKVSTDVVSDLSPLRALSGLRFLHCAGKPSTKGKLSDLSLLDSLKLESLHCENSSISDLLPLARTGVKNLWCVNTNVSDLSPLAGTPIVELWCDWSLVSDLTPLQQCKDLKYLSLKSTKVTPASIAALQKALPNCKIEWDDPAKAKTPAPAASSKLFMHDPAFPQWMKDVQAMTAEQQIEAVSKKLMEVNPGFDGKVADFDKKGTPKIVNGVVMEIAFNTDRVVDISPVRALTGLTRLGCSGINANVLGKLSDLSPLSDMKLTALTCAYNPVSDLSPLNWMPLTMLIMNGTQVTDLSPLRGMKLRLLHCGTTQVSDLSALEGMPLLTLWCDQTAVSDLTPVEKFKDLKLLSVLQTKVTPASVAALQKALPNCKIEWDDPAKAMTPQAAASGTK
ncbi:MAG: hypothetical protein C0483_11360 [Pirellula sp.]|nr:hypothetical protein [Pirellula sp.]